MMQQKETEMRSHIGGVDAQIHRFDLALELGRQPTQ